MHFPPEFSESATIKENVKNIHFKQLRNTGDYLHQSGQQLQTVSASVGRPESVFDAAEFVFVTMEKLYVRAGG